MIYVSKGQLKQVEYLLQQSMLGNHVLFDPETVRRILSPEGVKPERGLPRAREELSDPAIEKHIESLILLPTLLQKRTYLERLDRETFEEVVKTYFHIVENRMLEAGEVRH